MLQKDSDRFGYKDGVGPITPEQAFNSLPESLKDNMKIVEVDGKSYVVRKTQDADDVRNGATDIITPKGYLRHIQQKMEKIIEKDKKINSPMSKASNVAYDVLNSIGGIFYPESAKRNIRKNLHMSEADKKMLKDYNERDSKNMSGLLEDDNKRIGYAAGPSEEEVEQIETRKHLKKVLGEETANTLLTSDRNSPEFKKAFDKAVVEEGMGPDGLEFELNKLRGETPVIPKDDNRIIRAEGGSLLADDMVMKEEFMVEEPMMNEPEKEMLPETPMESDEEMEDNYLDFIIDEALSEEEEDMLMSKLEQDEQLSMLFDKVIEVASEFAGSGPVEGPGSGVSDSIPARLSDGEFVFTAKAVEEIGADNLMAMMKDAEMKADERQGLAEGGQPEEEEIVVMPVEQPASQQDIRVTKTTVGSEASQQEVSDLVDEEVKKSMLRGSRNLG